jgi:hypothetical protein
LDAIDVVEVLVFAVVITIIAVVEAEVEIESLLFQEAETVI